MRRKCRQGGGNLFADDSGGFICFSPTATPATSNSNIIAVSATAAHTEEPHHPAVAAAAAQSSYSQRGNIFIARWNITLQTWKVKKKKKQPTNKHRRQLNIAAKRNWENILFYWKIAHVLNLHNAPSVLLLVYIARFWTYYHFLLPAAFWKSYFLSILIPTHRFVQSHFYQGIIFISMLPSSSIAMSLHQRTEIINI